MFKKYFDRFIGLVYQIIASTKFFIFSIGIFLVHTIWLALSAYSLPFDEYYHLGIIQFYSHQWSPFIASQPADMSYVGDMTRLPSYLYHYLMSFPYRILNQIFTNDYWVIVSMRLINIVVVVIGVVLFRKLMLKIGLSRRLTHLSLFVFMLIPMIVYLAAEPNYDNLMFLMTPIFLNYAYELYKHNFTIKNIVGFVSMACLGSLIKNQFVVFVGLTTLYLVVSLYFNRPKHLVRDIKRDITKSSKYALLGTSVILLLSVGLFVERYGVNLAKYQQINVQCQKVQSLESCLQYSPWRRNYFAQQTPPEVPKYGGVVGFSRYWVKTIARGFVANFANVPGDAKPGDPYGNYEFAPLLSQMIIAVYVALFVFLGGVLLFVKRWWKIGWLRATICIFMSYALVLWLFNLRSYLSLGRAYAIQPRYLLPLIIPVIATVFYFGGQFIRGRNLRGILSTVVIILFISSGGAIGWAIRSNAGWYYPSDRIIQTNQSVQSVLKKLIYNTALLK